MLAVLRRICLCFQRAFHSWSLGISATSFVKTAVHLKWVPLVISSVFLGVSQ